MTVTSLTLEVKVVISYFVSYIFLTSDHRLTTTDTEQETR